ARDLAKIANEDPMISQIIPDTEIPQGNQVFKPLRTNGLLRWSHMYNPRQLLALYHLTKYVQDRCRELCEKEGELGAAIATYLALALAKLINRNNIATEWNYSGENVRDVVGSQYALSKEVKLGYDFCEAAPFNVDLPWAFEVDIANSGKLYLTAGGILPVLRFLCERLHGLGDRVSIVLADAAEFSKWLSEFGVFDVDLVHVDPPYYDQHRYGDIMEFFWVVLRRALLPAIEMGYLFSEKEQKLSDWSPYLDEVPRKHEFYGKPGQRGSMFEKGMNAFFSEVHKVLRDDGRLVLWFTHSSIQAWEDLFTWLYRNGFEIVKTWQIWSEFGQRIRALYKSAFFTSMVIVARKIENRSIILDEKSPEFVKAVEEAVRSSIDTSWSIYGGLCREMIVMAIADGQAVATRFRLVKAGEHSDEKAIFQRLLANATACAVSIILKVIAEKLGLGNIYPEYSSNIDNESILYLFALISSGPDLKVPYDFFEKLRKELRAYGSLLVRVRSGKEYEIPVGQALLDLVKGRAHMYAASLATDLILRAVRDVPEVGSSSFIKNIVSSGRFRREHVAYALYLLEISRFNNVLMNRLKLSDANIALISETLRKLLEEL
ncbi:MAG: hypothetical protein GXO26_04265, partial [Crenarchaeota archaeon]|nr:hypothetical protein [Thermoproteota archaeon]